MICHSLFNLYLLEIFVEKDLFGMLSPGTYFVSLDARTKRGDIEWCNQIPFLVAFHQGMTFVLRGFKGSFSNDRLDVPLEGTR